MALCCVEKIIGLIVILIIFSLITNSKSEHFSCGCKNCPCGMNCNCGMNCPCRRGGRCNCPYARTNFGSPYDDDDDNDDNDNIENFASNKKHILVDNMNGNNFYLTDGTFEFRIDNKSSEIHTNKNNELQHYNKYVKINKKNQKNILVSDKQGNEGDFVPLKLKDGFIFYENDKDKYYFMYKQKNIRGIITYTKSWIKNIKPYTYDTFRIIKIN